METDATWKRVSRVLGTLRSRSAKPYAFSKTIFPFSLARTAPLKFPLCTYGWRYASMRSATELSCAKACSQQKVKPRRSEEHTSELQSLTNLVCRLLLEKKKKKKNNINTKKYQSKNTTQN